MNLSYEKIITILFAALLTTTGIIWNNSQGQTKENLVKIEELTKVINVMQIQLSMLNYKVETLTNQVQNQSNTIDYLTDQLNIKIQQTNQGRSRFRFERQ